MYCLFNVGVIRNHLDRDASFSLLGYCGVQPVHLVVNFIIHFCPQKLPSVYVFTVLPFSNAFWKPIVIVKILVIHHHKKITIPCYSNKVDL